MDQQRKQQVERGEESRHMNGFPPRDLLRRFREQERNQNQNPKEFSFSRGGGGGLASHEDDTDDGEIELNLGLSLGGRFGIEPKYNNNSNNNNNRLLLRSSSIAGLTTVFRNNDDSSSSTTHQPVACQAALIRTCSLPTETEEEWRKRKELQSLRRMEAKRKRSEKQSRNLSSISRVSNKDHHHHHRAAAATMEGNCDGADKPVVQQEAAAQHPMPAAMNVRVVKVEGEAGFAGYPVVPTTTVKQEQQQQFVVGSNGFSTSVPPPFSLPFWAAMSRAAAVAANSDGHNHPDNGKTAAGFRGLPPPSPPGSQGSSGISEFDNRPVQGLNGCTEARSPSSVQSITEQKEQQSLTDQKPKAEMENPSKKSRAISNGAREMGMKGMDDMPCVSTRGDGPNGKKIEGFLYKYRKGEEVRIVCVCHGSFLTPAEFVKHAGGGDVTNPLRHIVVSPSPSFL